MGGSGAEQQAQYHPWGVSSAFLFTNNAFGSHAADARHPQAPYPGRHFAGKDGARSLSNPECQAVPSASLAPQIKLIEENLSDGGPV